MEEIFYIQSQRSDEACSRRHWSVASYRSIVRKNDTECKSSGNEHRYATKFSRYVSYRQVSLRYVYELHREASATFKVADQRV